MIKKLRTKFYKRCIQPRSVHPDDQRREFTYNILIGVMTLAASITFVSSTANHVLGNSPGDVNSIPYTGGFLVLCAGVWWLSRRGRYQFGAYVLSGLVWLASLQLMLAWSFELPMAQLVNVLVIAVVGVVLSPTAASVFTSLMIASTLLISHLQIQGTLVPNTQWLNGSLEFSDAVGQAVIYVLIGSILWLSNREIDNLLRRAWRSEAALAKERDQLEVTVAKRTQQLEQAQLARVLELQQFAEFGRVSASLLHDLATPLTTASLNLEQAGKRRNSKLVAQAMTSVGHIERYVAAARKQLNGSSEQRLFNLKDEVNEVVGLLQNQAQKAKVKVELVAPDDAWVQGDLVSFHRVMANIIINAIQAYDAKTGPRQPITIEISKNDSVVHIAINDHGVGIAPTDIPHIFDDFYSTKKQIGRGLGLGLANAQQVIEHDFKGSITATSSPKLGTIFTIEVPLHEATDQLKPKTSATVSARAAKAKR